MNLRNVGVKRRRPRALDGTEWATLVAEVKAKQKGRQCNRRRRRRRRRKKKKKKKKKKVFL